MSSRSWPTNARPIKRLDDAGLDIPGQLPDINTAAVPAAAADEVATAPEAAPEAPAAAAAAPAAPLAAVDPPDV